jgi:hypothetical protein
MSDSPATKTVRTIQEHLEQGGAVDATAALDRLWSIQSGWREQVLHHLDLTLDPSTEDVRSYTSTDGQARGEIYSYTGPQLAYFVNSWVGNPALGFTNLHFNLWVAPEYRVPHLGIVFGTIPDLFFYVDYASRVDMVEHADHLDRYFSLANDDYLAARELDGFTEFTSIDPYIRLSKSPVGIGGSAALTEPFIEQFAAIGQRYLDRWLGWMDDAERTPTDEIDAQRRRDLAMRREQGRRDPANPIGERMFGAEKASRLLNGLWGMDVEA